MITVGYGDISPVNNVEKIFGILLLFISCGVFAFSLNSIGSIIQKFDKENKKFRKFISDVDHYLYKRGIKVSSIIKIKRYLEYSFEVKQSSGSNIRENLISSLPETLKNEFYIEQYRPIMEKDEFFNLFSEEFRNSLAYYIQEITLTPEEYISEKLPESEIIYFVLSGSLQLSITIGNTILDLNVLNVKLFLK